MISLMDRGKRAPTAPVRRWLITGVSGGLGRAIAQAALAVGDMVVGTVLDADQMPPFASLAPGRAHPVLLDVTDGGAIADGVAAAIASAGGLDVLVNNAGSGLVGAIEETGDAEARRLFNINFFGTLAMVREVLPHMRARGDGTIVNVSSSAGFVSYPGTGLYSATKFAVEGMSEALAAEVAPLGIRVIIVQPGSLPSGFFGAAVTTRLGIADYARTPVATTRVIMPQLQQHAAGDLEKAGRAVVEAVGSSSPPLRLPLGSDALHALRIKIESLTSEIDRWETLSRSTDRT